MLAKDLIKILSEHPERVVVLSKDSEGNAYNTLYQAQPMLYDIVDHEVSAEGEGNGVPAIVLWP